MVLRWLLAAFLLMSLASCATVEQKQQAAAAYPDFSKAEKKQALPAPPPLPIKETVITRNPLEEVYITIDSVNQTLSAVLYMIAAEAGLNLIISPDINVNKPFTLSVNRMPAKDALEIICENAGVYYSVEGNALKIKSVVTKLFKLPFIRNTPEQTALVGGDIFGSSGEQSIFIHGEYKMEYTSEKSRQDIQGQIISHVKSIIFPDETPEASATAAPGGTAAPATGAAAPATPAAAPAAAGSAAPAGATGDSVNSYFRGQQGYNYNIFTGLLRVSTTPVKMKHIEEFINEITKEMNKQVIIEARLVEVVLNEANAYGINWSGELLNFDTVNGAFNLGYPNSSLLGGLTPIGAISSTKNLSNFFVFMASQGRVETVGNPRLRVMNGQSAMISSGQLLPYWEMTREEGETVEDPDTITYSRVMVLDGLILGVTPYIKDDDTITLNIVPIFSDVESEKQLVNANGEVVASYPIVNMKEAGTVLNMKSGSTVIMGGLISNIETTKEEKIPVLGDIPIFGNAFKGKSKVTEKRELVIFLTTTIIDGSL